MAADIDKIRAARQTDLARAAQSTLNPQLPSGYPPFMIGKCEIPFELETRHFLLIGTTGAGKTQAIKQTLEIARKREAPIVMIDHGGELLQFIYREGIDIILNPMDERSVGWSVFNELIYDTDFELAASLLIPDVPNSPNQEWITGTQQMLADVLERLWELGPDYRKNEPLLYFTLRAPLRGADDATTLEWLLKGTTSARQFEEGNEKGLAITMGIMARHMRPLTHLKEGDFSVTGFMLSLEEVGVCRRSLILSYTDRNKKAISPLMAMWMEFAVTAALELSESALRRAYLYLDELATLHAMNALEDALSKLRKFGGVVIAGLQSTVQMDHRYGELIAQALRSCFGTWLMLRVGDGETAEELSKTLGDHRTPRSSISISDNSDGGGGQSVTTKDEIERLVLASNFSILPDRTGYLRIAGTRRVQLIGIDRNLNEIPDTMIPVSTMPRIAPKQIARPEKTLAWRENKRLALEPEIETLYA
jgi:Type IV secretion-system coupling protein DNA-binding domain